MKCPFCGSLDTQVVQTRDEGDYTRRRRKCGCCQKRFTTHEVVEIRLPQIVKQSGERVGFDMQKLHQSLLRPLHKRAVPTLAVDAALERIRQQVLALGEREMPSRAVGEMVMQELAKLDKVAYIRFASVYRSFQDASDFTDVIREVE